MQSKDPSKYLVSFHSLGVVRLDSDCDCKLGELGFCCNVSKPAEIHTVANKQAANMSLHTIEHLNLAPSK